MCTGCRAPRRRSCARCCWNSKSPTASSATAAAWYRCYKRTMRIAPILRLLVLVLLALCLPARAQAPQQSFAAFTAKLWPDAQAKGIARATFDTAMQGVTPDQRVIAATKRQPEYGKP